MDPKTVEASSRRPFCLPERLESPEALHEALLRSSRTRLFPKLWHELFPKLCTRLFPKLCKGLCSKLCSEALLEALLEAPYLIYFSTSIISEKYYKLKALFLSTTSTL